jgi:hypothetical protein
MPAQTNPVQDIKGEEIVKESISEEQIKPGAFGAGALAAESVTTAKIAAGAVTEAKLGAESVGEGRIKTEAVSFSRLAEAAISGAKIKSEGVEAAAIKKEAVTSTKVLPATLPVAGAEKAVVVGAGGVVRKITAVHTGDGAETKVKVKHSFETEAVNVVVQKGAETKKPGENFLNAAGAGNITWKPISLSEVEVTFGTAPAAKFESYITVAG